MAAGMTDNTERDELAQLVSAVTDKEEYGPVVMLGSGDVAVFECDVRVADAVLAAGFRRPRTIGTAKELDTLHDATVILPIGFSEPTQKLGDYWYFAGGPSTEPPLPAIVLWEPNA